jgi:dGTP triphosphohydrolase
MSTDNLFGEFTAQTPSQPNMTPQEVPQLNSGNMFEEYAPPKSSPDLASSQEVEEVADFDEVAGALVFLEGLTFGFSDEIGLGVMAGVQAITSDEDIGDIYDRERAEYKARLKEFENANPIAATALEVGGAIANPLNFMGKIKGAVQLGARAMGEGALYGLGKGESLEDRATKAAEGAAYGLAGAGIVSAGGFLLKGAFGRRVAEDLEKADGSFTPITLAIKETDGGVADFVRRGYRDVIAPSFGGSVVREQENVFIQGVQTAESVAKKNLEDLKVLAKKEIAEVNNGLRTGVEDINEKLAQSKAIVADEAEDAKDVITRFYSNLDQNVVNGVSRQAKKAKELKEGMETGFRVQAFNASLPSATLKADRDFILNATTPNQQLERLSQVWASRGFSSIKGKKYKFNIDDLASRIRGKLEGQEFLRWVGETKDGIGTFVNKNVALIADDIVDGKIDGARLAAIRSGVGRAAGQKSDVVETAVLEQVRDAIDDIIFKQLTPKQRKAFNADKKAWQTNTVLRKVVEDNSAEVGKRGVFTPEDWVKTIKKVSPYSARIGKGALRDEAESIGLSIKKLDEGVKASAKSLSDKLSMRKQRELTRQKKIKQAKQAKLRSDATKLKRQMRQEAEFAKDFADNKVGQDKLVAEIASIDSEIKRLNQLRSPARPTWYHVMAANNMLGGGIAAIGNVGKATGMTALSATGLGRALASPTGQKVVVGQTATQQALMRGVEGAEQGVLRMSPLLAKGMLSGTEQ